MVRRPTACSRLMARETQILRLVVQRLTRCQIAHELALSQHTVRHHLEHIYAELGVGTRVAAAVCAVHHDLIQ
jgi:DNA-binding NarL/FixJ family response regulator